jgi:hypothetical protein
LLFEFVSLCLGIVSYAIGFSGIEEMPTANGAERPGRAWTSSPCSGKAGKNSDVIAHGHPGSGLGVLRFTEAGHWLAV